MQKVSEEYQRSMKSSLRERGYIMLSFGLINQEIQTNASVSNGDFAYFSNSDIFGNSTENISYATMESDYTKVDGSMRFLPRESSSERYYNAGLVSKPLISAGKFELTISLNTVEMDFKGVTIDFGENYPIEFDLVGKSNTLKISENDKSLFTTEEVFEETSYLKLVVYKMKNQQSRLRICSICFGFGLVFHNDSVMSSSLESSISPIGAELPQIDFSVTLKNYDRYFDVDNPKSSINFLETGQQMDISYGYYLPESDRIEWISGNHLLCAEWESDSSTATIRCHDVFRSMDSDYIKGSYSKNGVSYYDLAVMVLSDAGITKYNLDPRLKTLKTNNPIPIVKHKEALQIIANACCCTLLQNRAGEIQIASSVLPDNRVDTNGETAYSKSSSILINDEKDEYGSFSTDYSVVDGNMFFLPKSGKTLNTGYISSQQSDENGVFETKPIVSITLAAAKSFEGVKLVFGNALPSSFTIMAYRGSTLLKKYTPKSSEISKTMVILTPFENMNKLSIRFDGTQIPNNRILLNYLSLTDLTYFTMSKNDMLSSPKSIKQEKVKNIVVPCYHYQQGSALENLVNEEVDVKNGDVLTYYLEDPAYNFKILIAEESGKAKISEYGCYYVSVQFLATGTFNLTVQGYRYKIIQKYAIKKLNQSGKTIKWENPLISNMQMAQEVADWLGDYYSDSIEYEYETRGNPELDINDVIYQENDFKPNMKVLVCRHTLGFDQAFSGKITVHRLGG